MTILRRRPRARLVLGAFLGLALPVLSLGAARAEDPCADHIPQPKPQNASRDIVGQDLDTIQERGFVTVAVYRDFPPYSWQDGTTPRGIDVEIAALIAADLGVEPRYRFVDADETLDADLRNNLWRGPIAGGAVSNIMMRVPYDSRFACRVEQVVFTGQYADEAVAIAYDAAKYPDGGPTPPYFRFDTVSVKNDSLSDFYLSSAFGGQMRGNVKRHPTMGDAMAALASGETDAAMGPLAQIEWALEDGLAVHRPPLAGLAAHEWTIGLGVHFAYRPLAYSVDDAIWAALADGRIAAIYERYGLTHLPPGER